jgi:RimJ/RimL family protein N-acetyltransferase
MGQVNTLPERKDKGKHIVNTPIELETERLRLRQWTDADLEPFAALNADPDVMAYFPETLERSASNATARKIRALIAQHGWGFWAVEVKREHPFIGFVGLHEPEADLPFSPCVEVGWRLAATHWGRGYATEAARKALRFAFDHQNLEEVVAFTAVGNWRSRKVMARLQMVESETFDHPEIPEGHPLRQHVLYRLGRDAWRS